MFPLIRKKQPSTANLSRFTGKDILQRYPARLKYTAAFMVNGQEYHIDKKHAGRQIFVVMEGNSIYNVTDSDGMNIRFGTQPQEIVRTAQ